MSKKLTLSTIPALITKKVSEIEKLLEILREHDFLSESLDSKIEDLLTVTDSYKVLTDRLQSELKYFTKVKKVL